jgi:hypothetical protein
VQVLCGHVYRALGLTQFTGLSPALLLDGRLQRGKRTLALKQAALYINDFFKDEKTYLSIKTSHIH